MKTTNLKCGIKEEAYFSRIVQYANNKQSSTYNECMNKEINLKIWYSQKFFSTICSYKNDVFK